jgi:hypothetical protein
MKDSLERTCTQEEEEEEEMPHARQLNSKGIKFKSIGELIPVIHLSYAS